MKGNTTRRVHVAWEACDILIDACERPESYEREWQADQNHFGIYCLGLRTQGLWNCQATSRGRGVVIETTTSRRTWTREEGSSNGVMRVVAK